MKRTMTFVGMVAAVGLLLAAVPVKAHHSFAAAFDETKPINLQGTVTKVELVNPHSWVWIDVKGADGATTNWGLEGGPPVNLFRNGVTKASLPVGSEIKIFGYQAQERREQGRRRVLRVPGRAEGVHGRIRSWRQWPASVWCSGRPAAVNFPQR